MAFRTDRLQFVYQRITDEAASVKSHTTTVRNQSAAGSIPSSAILDLYIDLKQSRATLASLASTPGLAAYASNESSDENYDVAAEFTTMLAAIDGVTAWIETNFPASGGFLLAHSFSAGAIVPRMFTTAALATFRTTLDSLIATIN